MLNGCGIPLKILKRSEKLKVFWLHQQRHSQEFKLNLKEELPKPQFHLKYPLQTEINSSKTC